MDFLSCTAGGSGQKSKFKIADIIEKFEKNQTGKKYYNYKCDTTRNMYLGQRKSFLRSDLKFDLYFSKWSPGLYV